MTCIMKFQILNIKSYHKISFKMLRWFKSVYQLHLKKEHHFRCSFFIFMFILDLNPRGSVRKEKLPVASFQHRAAQTGTVALRRSASYKYAKQTVKAVYQLHLKKEHHFRCSFLFFIIILLY